VDDWLASARDAVAASAGVDAGSLELSDDETNDILDIARIAAHTSGVRTNAPLLCYLVGLAAARGGRVDEIADAVRRSSD
jgi:hypothetical protein